MIQYLKALSFLAISHLHTLTLTGQLLNTDIEHTENLEALNLQETLENHDFEVSSYTNYKLDLNIATEAELQNLPYLSDATIQLVFAYLERNRPLVSVLELQSIQDLSRKELMMLLQDVYVVKDVLKYKDIKHGSSHQHELQIKWSRRLDQEQPYTLPDSSLSAYSGSRDKVKWRLRNQWNPSIQSSITLEKDAGEAWLYGSNFKMADYTSAFMRIDWGAKRKQFLVAGDYALQLGQGLLVDNASVFNGFAGFRQLFKNNHILSPYQGLEENKMLRGLAYYNRWTPSFQWTLYASFIPIDSRLQLTSDHKLPSIIRYQETGLHRSQSERISRKNVHTYSAGSSLLYHCEQMEFGFQWMLDKLNAYRQDESVTAFSKIPSHPFQTYTSVFYNLPLANVQCAGEGAYNLFGYWAHHHTAIINLGKWTSTGMEFYHYHEGFYSRLSSTNSKSGKSWNEKGMSIQLNHQFPTSWLLQCYAIYRQTLWNPLDLDPPGEFSFYWSIQKSKRRDWLLRFHVRHGNIRSSTEQDPFAFTSEYSAFSKWSTELFVEKKIMDGWTWRTRMQYKENASYPTRTSGFLFAQDILYKALESKFQWSARVAYFETDDSNIRFMVYENDVLNSFSFFSHTGKGFRYYFNGRYKFNKQLILDARIALTKKLDVSSSLQSEEANKALPIEIKIQITHYWNPSRR